MWPLVSRSITRIRGSAAAASRSTSRTRSSREQSSTRISSQSRSFCSVTERIVCRSRSTSGSYTGVTTEKNGAGEVMECAGTGG